MEAFSGYFDEDGGIAEYDQAKARALDNLRSCDSYVVIAGDMDDEQESGMKLTVHSGIRTPLPPYFLAECSLAVSSLILRSIEDLIKQMDVEDPEPEAE